MHESTDRLFSWSRTFISNGFFLLAGFSLAIPAAAVAEGQPSTSTRYWDCTKPSIAWPGKASVTSPVQSCAKDGVTIIGPNTQSAGDGGSAYQCQSQQPWQVTSGLAYGFAAANIAGQSESNWGCACYQLTFTNTSVSGKTMVVQVISTTSDSGSGHFDLLIPGGGVGIYNACSSQYGAPADGWGSRYGGVSSQAQCSQLPAALQPGCNWRFTWFQNANNPTFNFHRVKCPSAITAKTGCVRSDDNSQPDATARPLN